MYPVENILFLDIETVSCALNYSQLNPILQKLWQKKAEKITTEKPFDAAKIFFERAAIYAEFGKIVTIALGMVKKSENNQYTLHTKAFADHNEKKILLQCKALIERHKNIIYLCAHNGKEFDFPYLCRRMLVHSITLPNILQLQNKKPWEVNHIDTMDMWKFGDRKNFTSLDLLAAIFNISSSKHTMDGSQVNDYFYRKNALEDIKKYCLDDVLVLAKVYFKMQGIPGEVIRI